MVTDNIKVINQITSIQKQQSYKEKIDKGNRRNRKEVRGYTIIEAKLVWYCTLQGKKRKRKTCVKKRKEKRRKRKGKTRVQIF